MTLVTEDITNKHNIIKSWAEEIKEDTGSPVNPLEVREYIRMRWPDMKQSNRDFLIELVMETINHNEYN